MSWAVYNGLTIWGTSPLISRKSEIRVTNIITHIEFKKNLFGMCCDLSIKAIDNIHGLKKLLHSVIKILTDNYEISGVEAIPKSYKYSGPCKRQTLSLPSVSLKYGISSKPIYTVPYNELAFCMVWNKHITLKGCNYYW